MTAPSPAIDSVSEFINGLDAGNRVAICGLYRQSGGASRVIQQQAAELTTSGYDVTIFALESDMEPPDGVDLLVLNYVQNHQYLSRIYWLLFPILPVVLFAFAKLRKFDIVIAHRYPFTITGRLTSLLSNTLYIYWSHPSADTSVGFDGIAKYWVGFISMMETRGPGVSTADYVVAVSEASRDYLSKYVDVEITTVRNRVNPTRFENQLSTAQIRDKYGIDDSAPVALFVGRLSQKKNVHTLIQIFNEIIQEIDAYLIITGATPQPTYYERLAEQACDRVVFTNYVSDEELCAIYELGDVFVTCSLEEGWGLPISEAAYFDLDIVAFESHPAAIVEDATYLVPYGDYEQFAESLQNALECLE